VNIILLSKRIFSLQNIGTGTGRNLIGLRRYGVGERNLIYFFYGNGNQSCVNVHNSGTGTKAGAKRMPVVELGL
jgi:hypothetical protein